MGKGNLEHKTFCESCKWTVCSFMAFSYLKITLYSVLGKLQVEVEMKRLKEVCEIGEEILRNEGAEIDEKV